MEGFIDMAVLPDPELTTPVVLSALFTRLHHRLVYLRSNEIGISFPKVEIESPSLGHVLRIQSNAGALDRLMSSTWWTPLKDHVRIGSIEEVPSNARHCRVRRVQVKSGVERLRRRQMKRHNLTEEQARERIPDTVAKRTPLPYLAVNSQSTGQRFNLFLDHQEVPDPVAGPFNAYGISIAATVPWF